jgi:predicted DNA-binding ribbon-helix-helix protein
MNENPGARTHAWRRTLLDPEKSRGRLIPYNLEIGAHRTSCRLDRLTWLSLHEIAERERTNIHDLCTAINKERPLGLSLTAANRVAVLQYFRAAATEKGHARAGHSKDLAPMPGLGPLAFPAQSTLSQTMQRIAKGQLNGARTRNAGETDHD